MVLKSLKALSIAALLLAVFLSYANTIDDLDLWWHLKSGQVMHETVEILADDPFAFTSYIPENISAVGKDEVEMADRPNDENNKILSSRFIKRNWLSQFILYFSHSLGGYSGIGILKSFLFTGAFLALYLAMRRNDSGHLISFLVLCLTAYIGTDFNYTRPQLFSYSLFACMLYTIYDFKKGGKGIYTLPVIMLAWANLHGGFVLGVLIVIAVMAGEFIKYALHNFTGISRFSCLPRERLKLMVLFSAAAILISFFNPGGYSSFTFPFMIKKSIFATVEEYHRPMLYEYHAYWLMLGMVSIAALVRLIARRLDITDLFIITILMVPSLKSNKYIIYFAIGSGIFLASSMSYFGTAISDLRPFKNVAGSEWFSKTRTAGVSGIVTLVLSIVILFNVAASENVMKLDIREKRYPSGAVDFIRENKLTGNMFNLFNWGGYLVWKMYPEHKVFIYGRAVNETALFHYRQIIMAAEGKKADMPLWKRLLNTYDINLVVLPAVSTSGKIIGLVDRLYPEKDWELIYADGKSLVFMRSTEENRETIHAHYLSKEKIYDEIITECLQGIEDTPATWGYYETLGYIYMKRNRIKEASEMFGKYLSMNPNNENVRYYYNLTKQYGGSQHGGGH